MKSSALIKRLQIRIMAVMAIIFLIIIIFSVMILRKEFFEIIKKDIDYYNEIIEISLDKNFLELNDIGKYIANRSNVLEEMASYLKGEISQSEAMINMGGALDYSLEVDDKVKSIYWFDWKGKVVTSTGERIPLNIKDILYENVTQTKIRGPYRFGNSVNFIIYEPLRYKGENYGTEMIVYSAEPFLNTLMELTNKMNGCEKIIVCADESCRVEFPDSMNIKRFGFRNDNDLIEADDEFFESEQFELLFQKNIEPIFLNSGSIMSYNELEFDLLDKDWHIVLEFNQHTLYERALYYVGKLLFLIIILLLSVGLGIKLILKPIMGKIIMNENELERTINMNLEQLNESWEIIHKNKSHMIEARKQKALTRLVQGLAHKINTPMGVILTSNTFNIDGIRFLRDRVEDNKLKRDDLDLFLDGMVESSNLIDKNADTIIDLITKLKYLSEDHTAKKVNIPLKDTVKIIVEGLNRELASNKFKVEINCEREIYYYGYSEDFVQVLTNLIINSIQHGSHEDGENLITINMRERAGQISIEYKDDGRGIAVEHLDKIFDPYFTTEFGRGSGGLGLYIVDSIIRNSFKGNITCTSRQNENTVFLIQFQK